MRPTYRGQRAHSKTKKSNRDGVGGVGYRRNRRRKSKGVK
jgi:hypothetical protein